MKLETQQAYVGLRASGNQEIYLTEVGGREVLFRPLTFSEYQMVLDLEEHLDGPFINDTILRVTCLWSEDPLEEMLDSYPAGWVDVLAELVMKHSGFMDQETFLDTLGRKRMAATRMDSIIEMFSCAAFNLTTKQFRDLSMEEQMDYFAKAEELLGQQVDVMAILSQDTEKPKAPPVDPNMESIVGPGADAPDFDKILKGDEEAF